MYLDEQVSCKICSCFPQKQSELLKKKAQLSITFEVSQNTGVTARQKEADTFNRETKHEQKTAKFVLHH